MFPECDVPTKTILTLSNMTLIYHQSIANLAVDDNTRSLIRVDERVHLNFDGIKLA